MDKKRDASLTAPSFEELDRRKISKEILKQTLQHPVTLFSGSLAIIAFTWCTLFDASPGALLATIGLAALSAGSWVVNFFFRGEGLARKHVKKLGILRERERAQNRIRVIDDLRKACEEFEFEEGLKELDELIVAYSSLQEVLNGNGNRSSRNLLGKERFKTLAEDTLAVALDKIQRALDLFNSLSQVNRKTLERELNTLKRRRAKGGLETEEEVRLDGKIESHQSRIQGYDAAEEDIAKLLAEVDTLEGTLEKVALQIGQIGGSFSDLSDTRSGVGQELIDALTAARRVEERLRKRGEEGDRDSVYLNP
jgi:hypothetical protein